MRTGLARLFLLILCLSGAAFAQAQAQAQAPAPAPAPPVIPARVAVTAAFAALDERVRCGAQAETLYLNVQNEGAAAFVVRSVRLLAPSDLQLCDGDAPAGALTPALTVEGGRRAVLPLKVGLRQTPRPGRTPMLIEVELAARIGGAERVDHVVAAEQLEIRIPGLSETLQLLGVPTLLLLPGVLLLSAIFLLFRPGWRSEFELGRPAFWMVAIPVSIGLSWLYTFATGRGGVFAERLGLWDIGLVWVVSIAVGLISGGLAELERRRRLAKAGEAAAAAAAARTITDDDTPSALFGRLLLYGGHDSPPQWHKHGDHAGFLVKPPGGSERWLIPQAAILTARPASEDQESWDSALGELNALVRNEARLTDLIAFLARAGTAGPHLLAWKDNGRPLQLDANDRSEAVAGKRYYVAAL